MTELTRICIYHAENAIEAHLLEGLLKGEGIDVELRGELLGGALGELPPTELSVDLWVYNIKRAAAEQVVHHYLSAKKQTLPQWLCRHCGEYNEGQFEICWHCQKESDER